MNRSSSSTFIAGSWHQWIQILVEFFRMFIIFFLAWNSLDETISRLTFRQDMACFLLCWTVRGW